MPRVLNLLNGSSPFYNVYTCKDGGWMSVGCLEPQFFKTFITIFVETLSPDFDPHKGWKPSAEIQFKRDHWPKLADYLTKGFLTSPRDFWAGVFHGMCSAITWKPAIYVYYFRNGRLCCSGINPQRSWEIDFTYSDISPSGIRAAESWTIFRSQDYPAWGTHRRSLARVGDQRWADRATERRGGVRQECISKAIIHHVPCTLSHENRSRWVNYGFS